MIRRAFFWLHLSMGITAGVFIFVMAATGVILAFERQIIELGDRDIRFVSGLQDARPRPMNDLLDTVRRAGMGDPTSIVLSSQPQAATRFSLGWTKTVFVDPYSGAVLGVSSERAREFFMTVERVHRTLGTLGPRSFGRWLTGVSNLLFCVLIPLGLVLWLPRKWGWKTVRPSIGLRTGLRGKAREWNWHNVIGIWCVVPLLVIALTGVVMSYDWANALLFRLTGSPPPASGRNRGDGRQRGRQTGEGHEPNYDQLSAVAKGLNLNWRTITMNLAHGGKAPVTVVIDAGTGGQPQRRAQYLLNQDTGAVEKISMFADASLGQRLRSFVRFGHTGEYYGLPGQVIAALASLGACLLVYTGLSLSIRRLAATLKRKRRGIVSPDKIYAEQPNS